MKNVQFQDVTTKIMSGCENKNCDERVNQKSVRKSNFVSFCLFFSCADAEELESTSEGYELLDVYKVLREHAQ